MSMDWFRHSNGLSTDDKLAFAAKKAGAKRGDMTAVWCCLLEHASAQEDRGFVGNIDLEIIAFTQEIDLVTVKALHEALKSIGRITPDGYLSAWAEYNPDMKKRPMTAAERVAKHRERKRAEQAQADVTKCNADVTEERYKCNGDSLHHRYTSVTGGEKTAIENQQLALGDVTQCNESNGVTTHNTTLKKERNSPLPSLPPVDNSKGEVLKNGKGELEGGTSPPFRILDHLSPEELAVAKSAVDGWDVKHLASVYDDSIRKGRLDVPHAPFKAFDGWCRSYTKGKKPR